MQKKIRTYLDALRLDRWPRSLAIIPGVVAALVLKEKSLIPDLNVIIMSAGAFILTWIISTANYIINEIADAPYDAFHPSKKSRPLVKGEISKKILMTLYFMMILLCFASAHFFYNFYFLISLVSLLVAGLIYNVPPVRVKDIPYLDSTIESANNPIRFLIGWFVVSQDFPGLFLLISWWAFGNFLMVGKRVAEKKFLTQEESSGYRRSLKKYSLRMLVSFMAVNGVIFIITFFLFAGNHGLTTFYFAIPFIIVYLIMFMKKSLQDIEGAEEPEKLLKNPYFAVYTIFLAIIFILAYIFNNGN